VEVDVPVHARAERLVLRVAAAAEREMLGRRAIVPWNDVAIGVHQRYPTNHAIWPILGYLDTRCALAVIVDIRARFDAVDGVAQRTRPAIADCANDLVHAPAARSHERLLLEAEHRRQPIRAIARMLARSAVIDDRNLLAYVRVAVIGDALRVLGIVEAARMAAIAIRLARGGAAPAQRHQRAGGERAAEPVVHVIDVGDEQRPLRGEPDGRLPVAQERAKLTDAGLVDEILQCSGRFHQCLARMGPRAERRHPQREIPQIAVVGACCACVGVRSLTDRRRERPDHRRLQPMGDIRSGTRRERTRRPQQLANIAVGGVFDARTIRVRLCTPPTRPPQRGDQDSENGNVTRAIRRPSKRVFVGRRSVDRRHRNIGEA
jgi:hypothetical protein